MPELPEVEIYTRYFAGHALHQRITRVHVHDDRILGPVRTETFKRFLRGRSFTAVSRHGKHLFAHAGEWWLHLHFGMSGDLTYYRDEEPRFARVVFDFAGGAHLAFEDMRLFGVADLTRDPAAFIAEHHLGPDPLGTAFTFRRFETLLAGRRGAIKSLLMTQEIIAGIGNLYADETLFQTSIHPRRSVETIDADEKRALFQAIRRILRDVIARKERGAGYPPRYLIDHREEGARCPRCAGAIRRTVVFGRTTYFCATHQQQ